MGLVSNGIKVIGALGETRVVKINSKARTAEEIIRQTLSKFRLREDHAKNYCFWVLDGFDPNPAACRRVTDTDIVRICNDQARSERNRLILRKIHAGEPDEDELHRAAQIAQEEASQTYQAAVGGNPTRSRDKASKLTGEPWTALQQPHSPISASASHNTFATDRARNATRGDLERERGDSPNNGTRRKGQKSLRQFFGQRPPSELISSNLTTYFPDHEKDDIEKTVRMSIRRSQRLSRAASRLSIASNVSFASSMKDAPPIPAIADTWLRDSAGARPPRPLSLARLGLPSSSYRNSVASSMLEPLREDLESPDDKRESYMSFDSRPDSVNISVTDYDGRVGSGGYYDDTASVTPITEAGDSSGTQLTQLLSEDGEEPDQELNDFLESDSWDNVKWIKGALIGSGSFGSVYLALHSITGELMAVKQVEMPAGPPSATASNSDNKKRGMVEALKREIGLLRDLQHPNIVQYLGSSSDEEHLNIFLEYVPGGSVQALLNQYGPLQEPLIRNFVRQILTGLAYLHDRDIIHRDIKGANVLVDNKGGIKISDFGISKRVEASSLLGGPNSNHRPSLQGSVFWMAPEVVKQTSYTRKADIWSLGCLVVEMFTGSHPYPDCSQLQAIFKIGNTGSSPTIPEKTSPEAQDFLKRTFDHDHNKRPSADELLTHPFLNPIA